MRCPPVAVPAAMRVGCARFGHRQTYTSDQCEREMKPAVLAGVERRACADETSASADSALAFLHATHAEPRHDERHGSVTNREIPASVEPHERRAEMPVVGPRDVVQMARRIHRADRALRERLDWILRHERERDGLLERAVVVSDEQIRVRRLELAEQHIAGNGEAGTYAVHAHLGARRPRFVRTVVRFEREALDRLHRRAARRGACSRCITASVRGLAIQRDVPREHQQQRPADAVQPLLPGRLPHAHRMHAEQCVAGHPGDVDRDDRRREDRVLRRNRVRPIDELRQQRGHEQVVLRVAHRDEEAFQERGPAIGCRVLERLRGSRAAGRQQHPHADIGQPCGAGQLQRDKCRFRRVEQHPETQPDQRDHHDVGRDGAKHADHRVTQSVPRAVAHREQHRRAGRRDADGQDQGKGEQGGRRHGVAFPLNEGLENAGGRGMIARWRDHPLDGCLAGRRPRNPSDLHGSSDGVADCRQSLLYSRSSGEMDEWFKSHAWKACIG